MIKRRALHLLLVTSVTTSCTAQLAIPQFQHGSQSLSFAKRPQTTVAATEDFDPLPYRDDLLLIQPVFDRAEISVPAEARPDTALVTAAEADSIFSQLPFYRIQVVALSDEASALRIAEDIRDALDVPVSIEPERSLFLIRAGDEESPRGAETLRERIVALDADYGDAYVLAPQVRVEDDGDMGGELASDKPTAEIEVDFYEPEPERVEVFGWRVLIDQFLSHSEAEKLRRKVVSRLGRDDVEVDFSAPYYKVEVGNFIHETEAQLLVEQIKGKGYRNALKVRKKVTVSVEESMR